MKAKVTRTKIAVAAGVAVLAAGLATPLAGIILPQRGSPQLAGGIIPNKRRLLWLDVVLRDARRLTRTHPPAAQSLGSRRAPLRVSRCLPALAEGEPRLPAASRVRATARAQR